MREDKESVRHSWIGRFRKQCSVTEREKEAKSRTRPDFRLMKEDRVNDGSWIYIRCLLLSLSLDLAMPRKHRKHIRRKQSSWKVEIFFYHFTSAIDPTLFIPLFSVSGSRIIGSSHFIPICSLDSNSRFMRKERRWETMTKRWEMNTKQRRFSLNSWWFLFWSRVSFFFSFLHPWPYLWMFTQHTLCKILHWSEKDKRHNGADVN